MTEPYVTVLREIRDKPNEFSLYVVASWCGKAADEIERLTAEVERLQDEVDSRERLIVDNELLRARVDELEGALDRIYNHNEAARFAVITHYGLWHDRGEET